MRATAKTHVCPYCGRLYRLEELTVVARARSGKEAREIIQQLNAPKMLRSRRE